MIFGLSAFGQADTRASRTWEVQKYDLTATLPAVETDRFLTVRAVLSLRNSSAGPASSLTLRISPSAEVSGVKTNGATIDFSKGEEKVGNGTLQRIILRGVSVAPGGNLSVEVNYKLKVAENSGLSALSPAGSQFLPLSFWYPTPNSWYFARGADYAPVRLQVVSANGQAVAAAGAESGGAFEDKLNIQPFFVAGLWETYSAGGVSFLLPKGAGADEQKRAGDLAGLISEAKTFAANLLGPAPDVPLRVVAVRRGSGFSGGGTILVDENVFRRQKLDALTAMTVAESVVKIWLGGAVRIDGDGGGTIREGLSRYLATLFLESKYGRETGEMERLRQRTAYAAVVKRDAPLTTASPLDDYYYTTNANKGAMIWRLLAKSLGQNEFFNIVRANIKDGTVDLAKLRGAFSSKKDFLDYAFDQVTDMDLMVGLPQVNGSDTKVNLRNTGSVDAVVDVVATTVGGNKLTASVTIAKQNFGEAVFKTSEKILHVEVDADKLYPQIDYSNDVVPREIDESDLLLYVKKPFDKQDFGAAEKNARLILRDYPHFDDVRVLLARSLLAQNRTAEAEKEFRAVLDEKLPTARSLAWSNVGLGEVALKSNQTAQAVPYFNEAIRIDAEYGATLAARQGKVKAGVPLNSDEGIKAFFGQFDKAAISGRKADLDAMVLSGEIPRFAGGIAGQAQEWTTQIVQIEKLGPNNAIVETNLNIRMINKTPESGTAVFRLTQVGGSWKLSGVDMFEVR
ncbi:MAG: tetratricopeptide repeat protein [Acidobacteria bacterium]|nr:tetratricopeptide repeat protein [Acidobacteriota bacterium]